MTKEQYYSHLLDMYALKALYDIVDRMGIDEFAAFATRAYGFCKELLRITPMNDDHLDNCETTAEFFKHLKLLVSNLQEDSEENTFLFIGKPGGKVHNMAAWISFFSEQGNPWQLAHSSAICIQQTCIEVLNTQNAAEVREILKWVEDFVISLYAFDLDSIKKEFRDKVSV